jgi:lipopolysaccharide/colanic/teichoic acid biosynthesis glycosyltransferase
MTTMISSPLSASRRRDRRAGARRGRLLDEDLFRTVLVRERRRAERTDRPIILVLVASTRPADWARVVERLTAAADAADVMGWCETGAVLGIVRTASLPADVVPTAETSSTRVEGALALSLAAAVADGFAVRTCIHPAPDGPDGPRAADLALYPDLTRRRARGRVEDAVKRGMDVAGSLAALALLAPVLAAVAVLVRLSSPGPVLFKQTRVGHLARPFVARKFRTMYADADPTVHREFVSRFIAAGPDDGPLAPDGVFKLANDRRITALGRVLRKTSLDELPQLWNVLRGEMSLVGPRPPVPYEYAQYRPWHRCRVLEAKPGLTGLWQVTGRSRTTFDDMVRLDLRYARTRTLWRDLAILCRTPAAVVLGEGAR